MLIFISSLTHAQQVTKVECCLEIGGKASIIINDNNSTTVSASKPVNTTTTNGGFDFKLDAAANTSAGVYNTDDVLVRTLWSGVRYEAGCYSGKWDGYLDDGVTLAPLGTYTAKVLTNNVQYTWEGVVGNTSKYQTGPYIHKGYFPMQGAAIAAGKFFYASGYSEGHPTQNYASLADLQVRLNAETLGHNGTLSNYYVCSDGTTVFWAGEDPSTGSIGNPGSHTWFVYGTDLNGNIKQFPSGTPYHFGYQASLDYSTGAFSNIPITGNNISSIDVQKNSNFLFVARKGLNQVQVLNKATFANIKTVSITQPEKLAADYSGHLWIRHALYVTSYFDTNELTGYPSSNAFDNNASTIYASTENPSSASIGIDFGRNVVINSANIYPWTGNPGRLQNTKIQGSADGSNYSTLFTISSVTDRQYNLYSFTNTTGYRYYRLFRDDGGTFNVAEIKFLSNGQAPLSTTLERFDVANDGSLAPSNITISNSDNYGAMSVSPITGELVVLDLLNNQIKFFNGGTGALNYTQGEQNGYKNSPVITTNKFILKHDGLGAAESFISFNSDGVYCVGDWGNFRTLFFNPDKTYKDQIAYIPGSRSATVDMNDPTRIFANYLEYKRDYSKKLGGNNGSWTPVNNWGYALFGTSNDHFAGFYQIATLSNGKTYTNGYELVSGAGPRASGENKKMDKYGNLYWNEGFVGIGQQDNIYRKLRTGFDSNGNPVYGPTVKILTSPVIDAEYKKSLATGGGEIKNHDATNGKWLFSNLWSYEGFHNGIMKVGTDNIWQSRFTPSTSFSYRGNYPIDGTLDIGNFKNNNIAESHYIDNYIFWNDHGEFYKGGSEQPNIWNQYLDDGLFIGNFGKEASSVVNDSFIEGNTFSSGISKYGNDYYVYHCGEFGHSGVHAIKVSNIASIKEQVIPLVVSSAVISAADAANLMANIMPKSLNFTGNAKWSFTPIPSADVPGGSESKWNIKTSVLSYKKDLPDLYIKAAEYTNHTAACNLGTNNTNNWTLNGKLAWPGVRSYMDANNINVQVLDAGGKAISNFTVKANVNYYYQGVIKFNNLVMATLEDAASTELIREPQDFSITNSNGIITFTYAGYTTTVTSPFTVGANFSQPASFRVNLNDQNAIIAVSELRFKAN